MKKHYKNLISGLVVASLIMVILSGIVVDKANADGAILISSTAISNAVSGGHYIFWVDARNSQPSIYGYDLNASTSFLITSTVGNKFALASDGSTVVWIEDPNGNYSIMMYNLSNSTLSRVIGPMTFELSGLAIDGNNLYYHDTTNGHVGLYRRNLTTGNENLVSASGNNPVAANGILLWSEEQHSDQDLPSTWNLHMMSTVTPATTNATIATGSGCFSGYSVSGSNIVWAFNCAAPDHRVYLYNISTGNTTAISSAGATSPVISGSNVVWNSEPDSTPGASILRSVQTYNISGGSTVTNISGSTASIEAGAIANQNALVFTVEADPDRQTSNLYILGLQQTGFSFSSTPHLTTPSSCDGWHPITCGQVTKGGRFLYDYAGRWKDKGVQFFLPQANNGSPINGSTFYDVNYQQAVRDGSLEWWLARADANPQTGYLLARTLRIFVDLPGDGIGGASADLNDVYDFAVRANAHGMRLGVVMHNSNHWTMDGAKQQWIVNFIQRFSGAASAYIAYVSADNEINNHCNVGYDCFDDYSNNRAYVNNALGWTSRFVNIFHSYGSPILTTVGISTGVADHDGNPPTNDFFRWPGQGVNVPRLVASVDFLSPHDYPGAAYQWWNSIRNNSWSYIRYYGPIVLEEFGYFTDPVAQHYSFTEGGVQCATNPFTPQCNGTAPFFVELNAQYVRAYDWAGSSAWMLADPNGANCTDHNFYSGLFTAGGSYCGGTYTYVGGNPKSIGFRVRTHHYYY